jgi:hypothetical protein
MPGAGASGRRVSYETRLLILTIVVSALVLLLLARLRFPETSPVVTATQPLDRLAARATYDDLATSIARLEEAIAPSLVTLRVSGATDAAPRQLADVLTRPAGETAAIQHIPALRIGPSTGVAALAPGTLVSGIVGRPEPVGSAGLIGLDPVRRLALVRLPEAPARPVRQLALADLRTPTYVVAVEGTRAGVTLRPVFLGRAERFGSARFARALLPLGGAVVTTGALMFTLQGEFLGCAVVEEGTLAIVSAIEVLEIVDRLLVSAPSPVDPGISVQPLTMGLAAATGAPHGVVVADVFDGSPASGVLEPGDVITQIDGDLVDTPDALLLQLGSRLAAGAVPITFARQRKLHAATLSPPAHATVAAPQDRTLDLQPGAGGARVSSVERGSAWEAAGLLPGDDIVRIGTVAEPSPAAARQVIADTRVGDHLMIVIRRGTSQRAITVEFHAEHDASRR